MESNHNSDESNLIERCLSGDEGAIEQFHNDYRQLLTDHLTSLGAERSEATELAANFIGECLFEHNGKEPRLKRFHGRAALLAWLRKSIKFYFLDFKRRDSRSSSIETEGGPLVVDGSETADEEASIEDATELLGDALRHARSAADSENYVITFLALFYGIKQGRLAKTWGYSDSKISRKISACLQKMQTDTLSYIKEADPEFKASWNDLSKLADDFFTAYSED